MVVYQAGETIRLVATITDIDDIATDPASTKITINDPDGLENVEPTDMENPTLGSYYYDYDIPSALGIYGWQVTATGTGDRITIVKDLFRVEAAL